ncbi:MAG: molybdopterin converting factor subunit 1 [Oscillochloridaceae bacterium umkhey_bin13]
MITVRVRFFAGQRDLVGQPELTVPLEDTPTVGALWALLVEQYPRLAGYSGRMLYAVNQEFATLTTPLHEGDEVAFIPPVSGGVR